MAGAQVVAAQLFAQFFVAMHDALARFDARFGREAAAPLASALKSRAVSRTSRGCLGLRRCLVFS